jgi:NAD(P)-dependent dehydrogenase (short-subunit alcohol dehydrogenase family)
MTDTAMSFDGKRVVVIGGASGIGFAVAELSRAQGADVTRTGSPRIKSEGMLRSKTLTSR